MISYFLCLETKNRGAHLCDELDEVKSAPAFLPGGIKHNSKNNDLVVVSSTPVVTTAAAAAKKQKHAQNKSRPI